MSGKVKTSKSVLGLGGLMLLTACGGATPAGTLSPTCSKSPSVYSKKTGGAAPSTLNLSASTDPTQPAVGTGFLDIETSNSSGARVSRRCTMSLRPIPGTETEVKVWTAGHCLFDPVSAEFKNSKFTLQIYLDGGYFNAPIQFTGYSELQKFSELFNIVNTYVGFPEDQISRALPRGNSTVCTAETGTYKAALGSAAKSIACFSRDEMRGIGGKLTVNSTSAPLLKKVISIIRERESTVLSKMDADTRRLLDAYTSAHSLEQRRVTDLRSISYLINEQFCAPGAVRPPPDKSGSEPDSAEGCNNRILILAALPQYLSASDLALAKSVYEDTTTPLVDLRKKTLGCSNITDPSKVPAGLDLTRMTPCDMHNLSVNAWHKFIDRGPNLSAASTSESVFGLNTSSYYGFYTNAFEEGQISRSVAKLVPLNKATVLNFEYASRLSSGAKLPVATFLVNFDPAKKTFNPSKGASGSILSAFGLFPMALLSTVNGEATSGGSSITPLPQVGEEEDSIPMRSKSNAGC